MSTYILAINPGSTSTKVAVYEDQSELYKTNILHSNDDLETFSKISDQYEMRYESIMSFLKEVHMDVNDLSAVVGRGGLLPPVKSGAYKVNQKMVDRLRFNPVVEHASNLGALIAFEIARHVGIDAYIYDPVAVDELLDIARISGLKEIPRRSLVHALNIRSVAINTARDLGKDFNTANAIIAHLGGGITIAAINAGKMVDIVSDDEGPFSPERSGRLPGKDLVAMSYQNDIDTMKKKLRGKGGLVSYLGTNEALKVEEMIEAGNAEAGLVYEAMAYQIAKGIGELATVLKGQVEHIILTGGIAYSKRITDWVSDRVSFIAPVIISPGENELQALAHGTLRVLKGEETAREYDID